MRISTKGRYGLRCMIDIAVNSGGDQVSIKTIAERQAISENYLEQVFSALRKAELVKSIKGSQGGYILSSHPSEIKVGDIIRALEGRLEVVENTESENISANKIEQVIANNVWLKINNEINRIIDSITLEDLINKYKELNGMDSYMYFI